MVQRKVANKLTIQIDHIKTKNQMVSLRSSSLHHQAELKTKKMKKSGSIKRQELDSPRSPNSRRRVKQPGKPPPPPTIVAALAPPSGGATPPHRQSPNYMKPTTSSDARKEQSQVTSKSPLTSPDRSSFSRKNYSGNKATKTTSLKTMRTLTKNPSFKPARVRKCSKVIICEDLDVKRATCSSTLKDCKFPAYLKLNHGGTESEGQSAIKVCPYSYCSLNGHHHRPPLPPLKCFLSARRIMIKNQRSIKLGCLSPRRVKPIGDDPNEKLSDQDDLKRSGVSEEENTDFFIEIFYTKKKEDHEEQIVETPSDGLICYDDTHETLDQNGDADSMDISETYLSEQNKKNGVGDEVSLPSSIQEYSEASDMEWEIGNHISLYLDDDSEYSPEIEVVSDLGGKGEYPIIDDEFIIKSEKTGDCFNEFMADEISQESFDEESLNSDPFSSSSDSESTGSYDYFESLINEKTAAPVEIPVEEPKPARDNTNECPLESNIQNQDQLDKECNQPENFNTLNPHSEVSRLNSVVAENAAKPENEESYLNRSTAKCKKPIEDCDELGHNFNPRAPNFLPLDPDPEAEKVDLKHQELDEKKNAEEWMVDYALRQAVTKLGPARKRKVTMLVEAFEKVMPITKCELHLRHSSALNHARTIQACN